jgi:hypothetical protein
MNDGTRFAAGSGNIAAGSLAPACECLGAEVGTPLNRGLVLLGMALRELETGTLRELAAGLDIACAAVARRCATHHLSEAA